MNKTLIANDVQFAFEWDEEANTWRTWGCSAVLDGYVVDLEANLHNFPGNAFTWEDMQSFLEYLVAHQPATTQCAAAGGRLLHALLKEVEKQAFTEEDFNHIEFEPGMIDFKGVRRTTWPDYKYDILYSPFDQRNQYRDLGSIIWRASFVNNQLAGVGRDI